MEVQTCLRAVQGLGSEQRISPLATGGKAKAPNEVAQHVGGFVVAALHKAAQPVAAEARRRFPWCDSKRTSRHCRRRKTCGRPCERGGVLKGLVAQAEGWGIGDSIEPHAAGPGGGDVEEGPGPVGGPKGQQLRVTGCVEGTGNMHGLLSELGRGSLGEAICGG
jgi:hypothetical protein